LDHLNRARRRIKMNMIGKSIRTCLLLAFALLAGASASQAQISLGINIGPPPRPRVVRVMPASPGPDYAWIGGYWYPNGHHYRWHEGYWTRPPYAGARWVEPRHDGQQFFNGYWDGDRGRLEHDHRWDHEGDRDQNRYRDDGHRDDRHDDHHDDHHDDGH
jgi:WXXGXW repeat (2 copies)